MRPNVSKKIRFMEVKVANIFNDGFKIALFLFGYFRKVFSHCSPGAGKLRFSFLAAITNVAQLIIQV